jgi:hypothetical protein
MLKLLHANVSLNFLIGEILLPQRQIRFRLLNTSQYLRKAVLSIICLNLEARSLLSKIGLRLGSAAEITHLMTETDQTGILQLPSFRQLMQFRLLSVNIAHNLSK